MDRATLRLELFKIAHHHAQSHQVTIDIVGYYEAAFADLALDGEGAERAAEPARKKAKDANPA